MSPEKVRLLVCPDSHEALALDGEWLVAAGGACYRITPSGQAQFVAAAEQPPAADFMGRLKAGLKHALGPAYVWLTVVVAPVLMRIHWQSGQLWWHHMARELARGKQLVIQVGSGTDRVSRDIVNLDLYPYPEVDVVADCRRLPFGDGTVDGVVSLAVVEHVEDPDAFLREARRVLKPGGFILTGAPFMQGYHASPDDYYRWTPSGLTALHARHGFERVAVVPLEGPTSGMLWVLQEWLAITLSIGITPLYYFWFLLFTLTLFPIKLIDLLLLYVPQSYRINAFNLYHGILSTSS